MLTGNYQDLSENVKSFVDDLTDYQIINISKRHFNDTPERTQLRNRHGNYMTGLSATDMRRIKDYCLYLIEIGAVKSAQAIETLQPILDDSRNAGS
jgi:hypothetical protein